MGERELDLVLVGATGFTGGLVAEHLTRRLAQPGTPATRWALAGRSLDRLRGVRDRLSAIDPACGELTLREVDASDPASLDALAGSTRIVATTVGPYALHGAGLLAACAAAGTDYLDITGEPGFVDRMWVAHHARAEHSGARIVHSCGFDSVPHDLGTLFTVGQLPEGESLAVEEFVRVGAAASGGTYQSSIHALADARGTRQAAVQRRRAEPRPAGRRVRALRPPLRRNPVGDGWALIAPTIDVDTVLRSARGLQRYGPDFGYGLSIVTRRAATAAGLAASVSTLALLAQVPPVRDGLLALKRGGEGPDEARRARSWFTARFAGRVGDEPEPRVVCEVRGGDPGYGETSKMLAESALCLAHDALPPTAGMVTPAVAMGEALITRLRDVGITFEVVTGAGT